MLHAGEHEEVFAKLHAASKWVQFQIKTTEGQHYQRYLLQQRVCESHGRLAEAEVISSTLKNVNDGKGSVFINYRGEAFPSRFLPLAGGTSRVRHFSMFIPTPRFSFPCATVRG